MSDIKSTQKQRDHEDVIYWSKAWWGELVKPYKIRGESLDDCKILLHRKSGKYASLEFRCLDGEQTIYGSQCYYLRNQWDREISKIEESYWYDDSGSEGWMRGALQTDEFVNKLTEDNELYRNATEEMQNFGKDNNGCLREFNKKEKDLAGEIVLPFIMKVDEVLSCEGKSEEDYQFKFTGSFELTEVNGTERSERMKMFQVLQLLSHKAT